MNFKANYQIISLSANTNLFALGYGNTSGSSVHQVYCVSAGTITIGAIGGGSATLSMTAGQTVDCLLSFANVASGSFIGFKSMSNNSYLTLGQV